MKKLLLAGAVIAFIGGPALAQSQKYTPEGSVIQPTYNVDPSTGQPLAGGSATTDISGSITTGGTYQQVLGAVTTRKDCMIQNPLTETEVLNVKVGTQVNPFTLAPGAVFYCGRGSLVSQEAVTVMAATTGHLFAGTRK